MAAPSSSSSSSSSPLPSSANAKLMLREAAQCAPEDEEAFQDVQKHMYFNTNNLWLRLDKLKEAIAKNKGFLPLPMIKNAKTIDPKDASSTPVVQLETAMGAAIECFPGASAAVRNQWMSSLSSSQPQNSSWLQSSNSQILCSSSFRKSALLVFSFFQHFLHFNSPACSPFLPFCLYTHALCIGARAAQPIRAGEKVQRLALVEVRLLLRHAALLDSGTVAGRDLLAGNGTGRPGLQIRRGACIYKPDAPLFRFNLLVCCNLYCRAIRLSYF